MNFFEHQDWARKRTALLVFLFAVAVVLVVLVTNVAVIAVLGLSGGDEALAAARGSSGIPWPIVAVVAVCVVGLIGGASGVKVLSLRRGGGAVAEMLGGRLVNELTDDAQERKLMNVVEEMAVASGTPVPLVYVLDGEPGINAFAAGHGPEDAAVAVTRGALEQFTRDELQGVMAHEFSHILNRDVRLNTRLTGLIAGILFLSLAGRLLLRGGAYGRIGRSNDRGGAGAAVAVGLVLVVVGYIGVFFGRLIKQAVSRQREFLADASAVQFTRNPDGLASALKKIAGWSDGSLVASPAAEEVGHFFFADGLKASLFGKMLSTHPPLQERIRRLDPSFTGSFETAGPATGSSDALVAGFAPSDQVTATPLEVMASVGTTQPDKLIYDNVLEVEVPAMLREQLTTTFGAVAVVFAMLLDAEADRRAMQLDLLAGTLQRSMVDEIEKTYAVVATVDRFARLPIVDLAMPALRGMSGPQFDQLQTAMNDVIDADDHLSLHEYAIRSIVRFRLKTHFGKVGRDRQTSRVSASGDDVAVVLSGLAHIGHDSEAEIESAYQLAGKRLGNAYALPPGPLDPSPRDIDAAVSRLARLPARAKQSVVDACAHSVLADDDVRLSEAELMRVVIIALGCPLPPFLPTVATA